jgi:hypothetical protein
MVCIGKVPIIFIFPVFSVIFVAIHLCWSIAAAYLQYLTGTYDSSINAFSFETVSRDTEFQVVRQWNYVSSTYFFVLVFGAIWGVFFFYNMLEFNISMMVV